MSQDICTCCGGKYPCEKVELRRQLDQARAEAEESDAYRKIAEGAVELFEEERDSARRWSARWKRAAKHFWIAGRYVRSEIETTTRPNKAGEKA